MPGASALPALFGSTESVPAYVIALYVCTHAPPEHKPVAQSALIEHAAPTAARHAPVAPHALVAHVLAAQQ